MFKGLLQDLIEIPVDQIIFVFKIRDITKESSGIASAAPESYILFNSERLPLTRA